MSVPDSAPVNLPTLQRAILALSAAGEQSTEVAAILQLSTHEVHAHLGRAMHVLGARSKLEAILTARRLGQIRVLSSLQCDILRALAGGATLIGTICTLARSLGVGVKDLRTALRELLETELIAVYPESRDRLIVRLERRASRALPALPPAIERRRAGPDIWLL
jgi:DNA-binding CsgD family transcriptional regulator